MRFSIQRNDSEVFEVDFSDQKEKREVHYSFASSADSEISRLNDILAYTRQVLDAEIETREKNTKQIEELTQQLVDLREERDRLKYGPLTNAKLDRARDKSPIKKIFGIL